MEYVYSLANILWTWR